MSDAALRPRLQPFVAAVLAKIPRGGSIDLLRVQGMLAMNRAFQDATVGLKRRTGVAQRFIELFPLQFKLADNQVSRVSLRLTSKTRPP